MPPVPFSTIILFIWPTDIEISKEPEKGPQFKNNVNYIVNLPHR